MATKGKHLAMLSGNNTQTSVFRPFAEIRGHPQGPRQYSGSITNTYKAT